MNIKVPKDLDMIKVGHGIGKKVRKFWNKVSIYLWLTIHKGN